MARTPHLLDLCRLRLFASIALSRYRAPVRRAATQGVPRGFAPVTSRGSTPSGSRRSTKSSGSSASKTNFGTLLQALSPLHPLHLFPLNPLPLQLLPLRRLPIICLDNSYRRTWRTAKIPLPLRLPHICQQSLESMCWIGLWKLRTLIFIMATCT